MNYFLPRPKKRLTTQEIELLIFCLFLSRFAVELYWTANAVSCFFLLFLCDLIFIKLVKWIWYLPSKRRGYVSLRVTWHSFCFWPERHDLVRRGAFILSCRVENKAAILCQLSSQRTKPSAGWRKTTENREYQNSRLCTTEPVFFWFLGTFPQNTGCIACWFGYFQSILWNILSNYWMNWHKVGFRHSWSPDDESHQPSPTQTISRIKSWHCTFMQNMDALIYIHPQHKKDYFHKMAIKSFSVSMSGDLEVSFITSWKYSIFFGIQIFQQIYLYSSFLILIPQMCVIFSLWVIAMVYPGLARKTAEMLHYLLLLWWLLWSLYCPKTKDECFESLSLRREAFWAVIQFVLCYLPVVPDQHN